MIRNSVKQLAMSIGKGRRNVSGSVNVKEVWAKLRKIVRPCVGTVSEQVVFPKHIAAPNYASWGAVDLMSQEIDLKTDEEIKSMRQSGALARKILDEVGKEIKVGITTDELDVLVNKLCLQNGAYPSPLNYGFFPKSVCTSVNNVACHGIPDDRPLLDGDIITVDVSVYLNGFHGDCATTFTVGNVDDSGHHLIAVTKKCLDAAIAVCKPDQRLSIIGETIEDIANDAGLEVCPYFCGHGIGRYFHGLPEIVHYASDVPGTMKERMVFTIEPVLTEGNGHVRIVEDGFTVVTTDNSRTAQFEHTILITPNGAEILTK